MGLGYLVVSGSLWGIGVGFFKLSTGVVPKYLSTKP